MDKIAVVTKIRIVEMWDDGGRDTRAREYNGREGEITHIDSMGQLHGTWGGLAVCPEVDKIQIL